VLEDVVANRKYVLMVGPHLRTERSYAKGEKGRAWQGRRISWPAGSCAAVDMQNLKG